MAIPASVPLPPVKAERRPFCFLPQRQPEAAAGAATARNRVDSSSARLASTMLSVRVVAALARALPRQAGLVSEKAGKEGPVLMQQTPPTPPSWPPAWR